MKELQQEILDVLEKHYHGRNFIERRASEDLLDLFNYYEERIHNMRCVKLGLINKK
jgi:hypothetical protein